MSPLTLEEVKERLKRFDEITILEMLGLTSSDLIELWTDAIEDRFEYFLRAVNDDE